MLEIGVDVGGTFTDVVGITKDGNLCQTKVPTTRNDLTVGILQGIRRVLEEAGCGPSDVRRVAHGTTVATNAVLEQKGARIGILMTDGFEDTLEIGRYKRSSNYSVWFDAETPIFLAPRRRRRGIVERIAHNGVVLVPLDEQSVREAIVSLVEDHAIEALAICYLFSFVNPEHEIRTAELVSALYPNLPIALSSEVNPEIREYERLCITALDAYIRPVVGKYLARLQDELRAARISAPLQVMESRGGLAEARITSERPSRTIMSGPAAGVMGAVHIASLAGFPDVISIDIGGTSSDVSVVKDGQPLMRRDSKIATYPVRVPMIDVNSIGAGGGSIAWFDNTGGLRVGPQSAGAEPGPMCYGRGGFEPTVTDASLVLGYLNADYFAAGSVPLDRGLALQGVASVAARLGVSPIEASWGIHEIVNASMIDQILLTAVRRGYDPGRFRLVVLGGAGAVHGCPIAQGLGISEILVPAVPGVLSAAGLLVSNVEYEYTQTFHTSLESLANGKTGRLQELLTVLATADAEGVRVMASQGVPKEALSIRRSVDMRYIGQSHELEIRLPQDPSDSLINDLREAFSARHHEVYGYRRELEPEEILNVRTIYTQVSGNHSSRSTVNVNANAEGTVPKNTREAYFGKQGGMCRTPVYDRSQLALGARLAGPLIVEQPDTTVVVHPMWKLNVVEYGDMLLTRA